MGMEFSGVEWAPGLVSLSQHLTSIKWIWRFWMFNSWSCLAGVLLLLTSLCLILRSTRCEEGGGGLF
eukprot:6198-Pelagomonas_calceolata.AAC.1